MLRARVTNAIAEAQNSISFGTAGWARPVTQARAKNAQAPTVTMLKIPTMSSAEEWSVRASSRSYNP